MKKINWTKLYFKIMMNTNDDQYHSYMKTMKCRAELVVRYYKIKLKQTSDVMSKINV